MCKMLSSFFLLIVVTFVASTAYAQQTPGTLECRDEVKNASNACRKACRASRSSAACKDARAALSKICPPCVGCGCR
jgi:hypothetical protein